MEKITKYNECYYCEFKKNIFYSAHVSCINPDTSIKGDHYGIMNNWFNYPMSFDPTWKLNKCKNFKKK